VSPGFASDNYSGAHPDVLAALAEANAGQVPAYGNDPWTAKAEAVIRSHLGEHARVFPVFNGTAANVLCLEAVTEPWEAVICTPGAHVHVDEAGAPERAGRKLLLAGALDGKLSPDTAAGLAVRFGDEHAVQPRVVTLTQSTELGTVYTAEEIRALADWSHGLGMLVHLDGARIANAAAALDLPLRALTTDAGVDLLSLGATKDGALGAEAVVFLRPDLAPSFKWIRKRGMQLASKMRFLSAQLVALYEGDLWVRNAAHANAMAARLAAGVRDHVEITRPVEANGVFAVLPAEATAALQRDWPFYVWDEGTGEVRWLCAWDTEEADVNAFAGAVRDAVALR
jgi:threonine aldolase